MPSCSRVNNINNPEVANNSNIDNSPPVIEVVERENNPDISDRCATLPRSSANFRLDLSPNLNRPDHIYERLEEPSTSTSSSTAPTHWRFKMFKSVSKNNKQNSLREGSLKQSKNNYDYDFSTKTPLKLSDKCFPTKAKNKLKISPVVNNGDSGSPISLNICFGKKSLHSPSNSQTLEFNDRSRENRDSSCNAERRMEEVAIQPQASTMSSCVYGRVGNTYGRLHVLGSGIGRIERHLSSSCGNIDHYCTPHTGNPRFRIENQTVEADRTYQNGDNVSEEASLVPADIRGISKSSLQWLMANRWLPLWVGNSGGKNEYKVIDLDFSLYDDIHYSACTSTCTDDHCHHARNVFETCSLYRRTCPRIGKPTCNYYEQEPRHEEPHVQVDENLDRETARNSPENQDDLNNAVEESNDVVRPNLLQQDNSIDNDNPLSAGENDVSTSDNQQQQNNSIDSASSSSSTTPTNSAADFS